MTTSFEVRVAMSTITCCAAGCGIVFGVPEWWEERRREDHTTFYCPNGHGQSFTGKSDLEALREQLASAQGNLNFYKERTQALRKENEGLGRSNRALRGVTTRLKKRAAAGVCAWCHRSFQNVARHVVSKHPGVSTEPTVEPAARSVG